MENKRWNNTRLKQLSKNALASPCKTVLDSRLRLSSLPSSSIFFTFCARAFFPDVLSSMVPASFRNACCLCSTSACDDVLGCGSGSGCGSASAPSLDLEAYLGLSVTEMVVPNRECREDAFRAKFRFRISSVARRRRRACVDS